MDRQHAYALVDNAAESCARMISSGATAESMDTLLPALISGLPLKADFEENATVYFPDDNSTHEFGNVSAVLASLHNATQISSGRSAADDTPCFTRSRRVSARPTPCRARPCSSAT